MKQLHSIVFLLVMLGTVSQAYALGLVAGALEPTQILNNIELGAIFGEEGITSFSTAALSVNDLIAKPIISGLISSAQQQASQSILDWANGGFEGQPLIVGNPEKFIRDAGLKEVRSALSQVPTGGYGDSIFNSIVSQYKNTGDIGTQIKTLSASNIPSIIQKSVCTDATLTSLAMQDVGNSDGTYVQAELASRKNQLFNYACVGNPSTDPNVAARLTDLSKQRPNLGGWDLWLTTTGGDNSYVATQKVSQAVAVSNNNKKDLAVKDIFGGGAGAVSAKKCVRYAEVTEAGQDRECLEETTLTPSEVINSSISKASTAGLDRLTSLQDEGLISLITNYAVSALTKGITSALTGKGSSSSSSNSATVVNTKAPVKKDLAGDPDRKTETLRPMMKQLNYYSSILTGLQDIDTPYLENLQAYQAKIDEVRTCYSDLKTSGVTSISDPGYNFYNERQGRIDEVKSIIVPELKKIAEAQDLIAKTVDKMNASDSSQEIMSIFNKYSDSLETASLPTPQTQQVRKGQYERDKVALKRDEEPEKQLDMCKSATGSTGSSAGYTGQ